jgi:hypothetical protein
MNLCKLLIDIFHTMFYFDREYVQHSFSQPLPHIYLLAFVWDLVSIKTSKIWMVEILPMDLECLKRFCDEFRRAAASRSSAPHRGATHS